MRYSVRRAGKADLAYLPGLEVSAAERFKSISALASLANDNPMSETELEETLDLENSLGHIGAGVWVIVDADSGSPSIGSSKITFTSVSHKERILGFLAARLVDHCFLYIAEMSVGLEYQGKGAGGSLLDTVVAFAASSASNGLPAMSDSAGVQQSVKLRGVTLTTYPDLDFNGRFYAKHGFMEVEAHQLGLQHIELLRAEKEESGLERDGWRRACMVRWIS